MSTKEMHIICSTVAKCILKSATDEMKENEDNDFISFILHNMNNDEERRTYLQNNLTNGNFLSFCDDRSIDRTFMKKILANYNLRSYMIHQNDFIKNIDSEYRSYNENRELFYKILNNFNNIIEFMNFYKISFSTLIQYSYVYGIDIIEWDKYHGSFIKVRNPKTIHEKKENTEKTNESTLSIVRYIIEAVCISNKRYERLKFDIKTEYSFFVNFLKSINENLSLSFDEFKEIMLNIKNIEFDEEKMVLSGYTNLIKNYINCIQRFLKPSKNPNSFSVKTLRNEFMTSFLSNINIISSDIKKNFESIISQSDMIIFKNSYIYANNFDKNNFEKFVKKYLWEGNNINIVKSKKNAHSRKTIIQTTTSANCIFGIENFEDGKQDLNNLLEVMRFNLNKAGPDSKILITVSIVK